MTEDATRIEKYETQSGRLKRSDAVILYESSRRRITFVPLYVERSSGVDNITCRITTYKKTQDEYGVLLEEGKSPWLTDVAARALVKALQDHLAITAEPEKGSYLVLKVQEGGAEVDDPVKLAKAIAGVLGKADVLKHFIQEDFGEELVAAVRGSLRFRELKTAIATLRGYLDNGVVDEGSYQVWCDAHSWVFGNAYIMRDFVKRISLGDHVDVLLKSAIDGLRDIVELKRPDMDVLKYDNDHKSYYFSSQVSKAIGQCNRYLDVLHDQAAKGLMDHPEIVAYHPRAIIIVGRSVDWEEDKLRALHGLNARMHGISVMTFDQLVSMGENLLGVMAPPDEPVAAEWPDEEFL